MDSPDEMAQEAFHTMAVENERLKRENRMLHLQREIDDLTKQIDQTIGVLSTSTPVQKTRESVGHRTPPGGTDDEISSVSSEFRKSRRRLSQVPPLKLEETTLKPDRFVTIRKKNEADPPSTVDRKPSNFDGSQTTQACSKGVYMKPATYDGSSSWTDYKAHFDACATLNGWDDKQKGLYLSVSLRGQAQGVFGNLSSQYTDYQALMKALEDRFAPKNQTELYRVQLRDRHQKATESMAELGQDIRRLANLAYPTAPADVRETLAKEQFIDALVSTEMRLRIKQARPVDLNDAVRHAVELESFFRAEKRQQASVRSTTTETKSEGYEDLKNIVADLQQSVKELKRQQSQYRPANRNRYVPRPYYGRPGLSNNKYRPRPQQSKIDFKNSDSAKDAHESRQDSGSSAPTQRNRNDMDQKAQPKEGTTQDKKHNVTSLGMLKSGLYASALIDGMSVDCLIDTGATLTLISEKLWASIDHNRILNPFATKIMSASGNYLNIKGQTEVSLLFGDKHCSTIAIVADIDIDVIIGLDFMQRHNVTLDIVHNTMQICGQTIKLFCAGKIGCFRVVLAEQIVIPGNSEMIAKGKVLEPGIKRIGLGLIEPSDEFVQSGNGMVARTLVQATETVPIRVANLCIEPKIYYPGMNIATIQKIEKIERNEKPGSKACNLPDHMVDMYNRASEGMLPDQQREVTKLLLKYSHIFSVSDNDLGRTGIIKHQIATGDARPIKQPVRRVPVHLQEKVDEHIDQMLNNDVIKPSTSPWASGIVLVKKKDGSFRFCIDYRRLNDLTIKDAYPLPRIDESLDQLAGSAWFSCLDLSSGYWQVEMSDSDKPKTAFVTRRGLFEFNKMPFGLCNAPATFERLMEYVLAGLHWKICLVYLDDIIVVGKTFQNMIENLDQVFQRFDEAGLKLKPKKCQLFKKEVQFLGHIINEKGIHTDPSKTECIKNWPTPVTVTEVRSFLGLCSYYRKFIQGYSNLAKPLTKLTEKNVPFKWDQECEQAFQNLKNRLVTAPVLAHPNFSLPFILDSDASDQAIAAVLSQEVDGVEKVIAFASRTLSKTEKKYCVTRKEMLALVFFVKYFKHYLYGREFNVRTDHGSLRWLMRFKNPEGQVARWIEVLSSYRMKIEHRAGRLHGNADAVSRIPCRQCGMSDNEKLQDSRTEVLTYGQVSCLNQNDEGDDSLKTLQQKDKDLSIVIKWIENSSKPLFKDIGEQSYTVKSLWNQFERLRINEELLVRVWENFETKEEIYQAIVPRCQRRKILSYAHDIKSAGHLGIRKTLSKIRQNFYWPGLHSDVRLYVAGCEICMRRKGPNKTKQAPMQVVRSGYPMERLAIDILGELPETEQGNRYILVIADYFTKWTECFPMRNMEASTVAKILVEEIVTRLGIPAIIHSDQGRQFESKLFQEMCQLLDIHKTRTTPYHPQSDGMVERFNRTLTTMLSAFVNENHRNWYEQIPYVMMAYRSAEHETTGLTPNLLMLGREVSTPLDLLFEMSRNIKTLPSHEWVWQLREKLEGAHSVVRENTEKSIRRQKQVHDRRTSYEQFETGDKVYVYFPVKKVGTSSKFTSFWRGPYTVQQKLSAVLYKVDCARNQAAQVVHCDRLRKCRKQVLLDEVDEITESSNSDQEHNDNYVDKDVVQTNDDSDVNDELTDVQSKRNRRKPVWAKDYVFSISRSAMPKIKTTSRKHLLPICPECKTSIPEGVKFEDHIIECRQKSKLERTCKICDKVFLKVIYLKKHLKLFHDDSKESGTGKDCGKDKQKETHVKSKESDSDDSLSFEDCSGIELTYDEDMSDEETDKDNGKSKKESGDNRKDEGVKSGLKRKSGSLKAESPEKFASASKKPEQKKLKVSEDLFGGRIIRKPTKPLLPEQRKVFPTTDKNLEKKVQPSQGFVKNQERKKQSDQKEGSDSQRDKNIDKEIKTGTTKVDDRLERKPKPKEVSISFSRKYEGNRKRQKLVIADQKQINFESTIVSPVDKVIGATSLNLGDYIEDRDVRISDIKLKIEEDGEITISLLSRNK